MSGTDERLVELDAGPPKITPGDLYRKMKREKQQKTENPTADNEGNMEDIDDLPQIEHKFKDTFKVPDVYSFDFKY